VTFTKIVTENVTTETTGTKYIIANEGTISISATEGFKYTVYYNDSLVYNEVQDNDSNDKDSKFGVIVLNNLIDGMEYKVNYKGIGVETTITQDDINGEIDKLCVMNGYTFISFVPIGTSQRPTNTQNIEKDVKEYAQDKINYMFDTYDRNEREAREEEITADIMAHFEDIYPDNRRDINDILYAMKKECVRAMIADRGVRPDGRGLTDIRPIWCEAGLLPRVHGSAVFTRGQTQVLTTATLGTISEAQKLEGLDDEVFKRYIHHYNMPGYSTGEAKPLRSPGRREIGHGALAERALEPVLPSEECFPYAIRTVSEVISSNGSTSQASVCGSTLALMDAGVPIKAPVAGVAMGLIKDDVNNKLHILTDIQGIEDFFGDMDFKVAGTEEGITAIQMDIKIKGINREILTRALEQARQGRLHILGKMLDVLPAPRKELSKYAPKIVSFAINPDKIREVIGSGGKTINKIIEETGVKIDISDDGTIFIASSDAEAIATARQIVEDIVREYEVGEEFEGTVVKIMENDKGQFGASVKIASNKEGMIHISKLSKERVEKVTDVVNVGDKVKVRIIKIDEKQRIDLKLIKKL
ncbi:MAG: polyribonucleotide nucleotidyltransferase, partial [Clostridia bacterium]|nr:polyribonucleotide nucleotidyltransferase [Clostridia bacterium]